MAFLIPSGAGGNRGALSRRERIYEYIMTHPGVHVRRMAKELGVAMGDIQYHLHRLERNGFVKTRRSGFYKFVYPSMLFGERQQIVLGVLSQEMPREILLCLVQSPNLTQSQLAERLGLAPSTISWHTDRLVRVGIVIRRRRHGRETTHEVVTDQAEILKFVKKYHPRVWDRWADRLGGSTQTPDPQDGGD